MFTSQPIYVAVLQVTIRPLRTHS